MTKYYSFHYATCILKLVKIDNFYSVIMNRKVVASSDELLDAQKLFHYIIGRLVSDPFNFNIQEVIKDFDSSVIFKHHRNKYTKKTDF